MCLLLSITLFCGSVFVQIAENAEKGQKILARKEDRCYKGGMRYLRPDGIRKGVTCLTVRVSRRDDFSQRIVRTYSPTIYPESTFYKTLRNKGRISFCVRCGQGMSHDRSLNAAGGPIGMVSRERSFFWRVFRTSQDQSGHDGARNPSVHKNNDGQENF